MVDRHKPAGLVSLEMLQAKADKAFVQACAARTAADRAADSNVAVSPLYRRATRATHRADKLAEVLHAVTH